MHPIVIYPLFLGSPMELGVLFLVVLILFGPGKLPQVFRSLGEGVRQFKDAADGTNTDSSSLKTISSASPDEKK